MQMMPLKKKLVQGGSGNIARKRGKKKKGRKKKEMAQSTMKSNSKDDGNYERFPLVSDAAANDRKEIFEEDSELERSAGRGHGQSVLPQCCRQFSFMDQTTRR